MHKLLKRLLRRNANASSDPSAFAAFIEQVSISFTSYDEDREILERSLILTSDELTAINKKLASQLNEIANNKIKLEVSLAKHRALFEAYPEAIVAFDQQGQVTNINQVASDIFQLERAEAPLLTPRAFIDNWLEKLENPEAFLCELQLLAKNNSMQIEGLVKLKTGGYYEYFSTPETHNGRYIGRVWCLRDVTEIKQNQEKLELQAYYDDLTCLPNRLHLQKLLSEFCEKMQTVESKNKFAVLYLDLDNFKNINDTAGHEAGDLYLRHVSDLLSGLLSENDAVGRIGGDEFLFILADLRSDEEIVIMCERIIAQFIEPYTIRNTRYFISGSIGVSQFPRDSRDAQELVRMADIAMYEAKRCGKNNSQFYSESMQNVITSKVEIESRLREAIEDNQFVLHYQPKIDLLSKRVKGGEALIRWQVSESELVYPDAFIGVAEDSGLIKNITFWVIKTACEKIVDWGASKDVDFPISVNISAIDLEDPQFLAEVLSIIGRYELPPNRLEFELTESVFLHDKEYIKNIFCELARNDVLISIDDFGTGYSSFSYLQDIEADYLKIDRAFITDVHKNPKSSAIVKSIIDLGKNLGMSVVAEGVECEEEVNFLIKHGCHFGQGYYYSKPVPESKFLEYLKEYKEV